MYRSNPGHNILFINAQTGDRRHFIMPLRGLKIGGLKSSLLTNVKLLKGGRHILQVRIELKGHWNVLESLLNLQKATEWNMNFIVSSGFFPLCVWMSAPLCSFVFPLYTPGQFFLLGAGERGYSWNSTCLSSLCGEDFSQREALYAADCHD